MPPDEAEALSGARVATPEPTSDTRVAEEPPAEEPAEEPAEAPEPDRPTAESLGRIAAPETPITRELAEAAPKAEDEPEEPTEPEERVADDRAEETITPELPEDAVVGLEPAELRPPELENPSEGSLATVNVGADDPAIAEADTPAPRVAEAPSDEEPTDEEPRDQRPEGTLGQVDAPAEEFEDDREPPQVSVTEPESPLDPVEPPQAADTAPPEATVAEPRLEPAEERPPKAAEKPAPEEPAEEPAQVAEAPTEREPAREKSWARENLPLISDLSPESYYLQVGAFSDPERAKSAVDNLRGTYPVAVIPADSGDRSLYRLFVGPLNEDERGSVLYWIRGKGYADAFIRKGGA
jgi:cell division septation protein DedD